MLAKLILPLGLMLALALPAAAACPGQNGRVILSDDFSDDSGGWDMDPLEQIMQGGLGITSDTKTGNDLSMNNTFNASEGDFCAVFAFPATPADPASGDFFALMVMAKDYKDRFEFYVDTAGDAWFSRPYNNNWQLILPPFKVSPLKTAPGAENALRIVIKDQRLTFYINGEKVRALKAQVPSDRDHFGFAAGVAQKLPAEARVTLLKSFVLTQAE